MDPLTRNTSVSVSSWSRFSACLYKPNKNVKDSEDFLGAMGMSKLIYDIIDKPLLDSIPAVLRLTTVMWYGRQRRREGTWAFHLIL
jgi:hypothetical protein